MDYGMIGKIEKARFYAREPERITFSSLTVEFAGDNNTYTVLLTPEGWSCTCPGYHAHNLCPHIMALEMIFKPMIKRPPLPYGPGQNVVSDVEKANRYAQETDRIHVLAFDASFQGDNDDHRITFADGDFDCTCAFFHSRHVCGHSMALEKLLGKMIVVNQQSPMTAAAE
ncbi:MAG: SWIM zinc finger family protein [Candidatus Flexifilum sp.]